MSQVSAALPMLRSLSLLLASLFALVPPGICQCRLEAMVLPCADHGDHADSDEGHHPEESCGCDELKLDCVLTSVGVELSAAAHSPAIKLGAVTPLLAPNPTGLAETAPGEFLSHQSLYLILRALRI